MSVVSVVCCQVEVSATSWPLVQRSLTDRGVFWVWYRNLIYEEPNIKKLSIYNGPTNALICNKTLIQMSHIKTFKITPTCFDYQMIIISFLILVKNHWLKFESSSVVMRQHTLCVTFELMFYYKQVH
jgi:hypothetical protein